MTELTRDERSPEAYFLKKLTGSDSTLIITADSTCRDVLVDILPRRRLLTVSISCAETAADRRKIIMLMRIVIFPLSTTGPVMTFEISGSNIPTRVTASEAAAIRI